MIKYIKGGFFFTLPMMIGSLTLVTVLACAMLVLFTGEHKSSNTIPLSRTPLTCVIGFSGGEAAGQLLSDEIRGFSRSSDIPVTVEAVAEKELRNTIISYSATNSLPDVFTYWGGTASLYDLASNNLILDMEEYLKSSEQVKLSQFPASALENYKIQDHYFGLPFLQSYAFWACNTDIFKKLNSNYPSTYRDLLDVSAKIKNAGITPLAIGSNNGSPASLLFSSFLMQLPGGAAEMEDLKNSYRFDTPNVEKVCGLLNEMREKGLFFENTYLNGGWVTSLSQYSQEKAAMCLTYSKYANKIPGHITDKTKIIPIPRLPGSTVNTTPFLTTDNGYGILISRNSFSAGKKVSIVKLVDFLLAENMADKLSQVEILSAQAKYSLPASRQPSILNQVLPQLKEYTILQEYKDGFPDSKSGRTFQEALDEFSAGKITAEQFIYTVQSSLEKARLRK